MSLLARLLGCFRPLPIRCSVVVVITFLASGVAGYRFAPDLGSEDSIFKLPPLVNYRDKPYVPVQESPTEQHQHFVRLAWHNAQANALNLVLGTAIFFFPVVKNVFLGVIMGAAAWNLGSRWLWARFHLPHALIELPLILYVSAISMHSGLKWLTGGPAGRWRIFKSELVSNLKLYLLLLPFIILAAYLEAYITARW